jgi:ferredoxin
MPELRFRNGPTVDVEKGISVLEAALRHNVPLYHTCGGNCSCSTCRVIVHSGADNLTPMEDAEAQVLDTFDLKAPHRLGCQALLLKGSVEVEVPVRDKAPRPNKTPPVPS